MKKSQNLTIGEVLAGQKESDVQRDIVAYLELRKCTVLQTFLGHAGGMAKIAREHGVRVGLKSTPGVPDLLVTKKAWPEGSWLGLEVKNAKGKLTDEQKVLEANGRIIVVRSIEDAKLAIESFEKEVCAWRRAA
jgi:hypothetical protein